MTEEPYKAHYGACVSPSSVGVIFGVKRRRLSDGRATSSAANGHPANPERSLEV